MASTLSSTTRNRHLELFAETIIGDRRRSSRIALAADVELEDCDHGSEGHLLVAINRTMEFDRSLHPRVHRAEHDGNVFEFSFPRWMDAQTDPRAWKSQSTSGALYLSRTDLMPSFGISGVILLQLLMTRGAAPCLTSRHKHQRTRELFDPLDAGSVAEIRRGSDRWQRLDARVEISPGVTHQLRNREPGPSVVLIQMYGDCRIEQGPSGPRLDMSDHIYQPE